VQTTDRSSDQFREGTVAVFPATLIYGDGHPPRFCDRLGGLDTEACTASAPRAFGLSAPSADGPWTLTGLFAARRVPGGFTTVVWLSLGGPCALARDGESAASVIHRNMADPFERKTSGLEGAIGASGRFGPRSAAAGADLRLTAWFDLRPDPFDRSLKTKLFGSSTGASLRVRVLSELDGAASTTLLAGVDPTFEHMAGWSHWVYPTLLGVALPEGGVGTERSRWIEYLGWTIPVSYRGTHPEWRQVPTRTSDWLGLEIAPTFLWYFGSASQAWSAGASMSAIVW
jgi:hypothetical protein